MFFHYIYTLLWWWNQVVQTLLINSQNYEETVSWKIWLRITTLAFTYKKNSYTSKNDFFQTYYENFLAKYKSWKKKRWSIREMSDTSCSWLISSYHFMQHLRSVVSGSNIFPNLDSSWSFKHNCSEILCDEEITTIKMCTRCFIQEGLNFSWDLNAVTYFSK